MTLHFRTSQEESRQMYQMRKAEACVSEGKRITTAGDVSKTETMETSGLSNIQFALALAALSATMAFRQIVLRVVRSGDGQSPGECLSEPVTAGVQGAHGGNIWGPDPSL